MSNLTKNIIWAIITLIVISLIFSYFVGPTKQPTTLNLDQLVADINNNQIKQIKVSGDELDVTMSDGSAAVAQKEDGVSITDTLKNLGVNQSSIQNVDLEIVNQSGWEYWAGILIDPLLTLLIIGFFFWFMFRQAKTGVNQAFQFGRSNLKLSTVKDKVFF
jgi:ATP-dependent Zn protease